MTCERRIIMTHYDEGFAHYAFQYCIRCPWSSSALESGLEDLDNDWYEHAFTDE